MVWQFPERMGFVEGELQVHSSSKCLKMFNDSFWIFLHVYLIKFFLSYWIFLCFYLVNFFFPYWQLKPRTAPPCFLADFFIPPLAPSINHFQCAFERTGHWLCSSPFEWGGKKRPFHSNKSRPCMNPSVLQTVNCCISPSNFKWESRRHHQTLCVETKDVNPTHKRPLKKKYIYIYTHTQQLEYANAVI